MRDKRRIWIVTLTDADGRRYRYRAKARSADLAIERVAARVSFSADVADFDWAVCRGN